MKCFAIAVSFFLPIINFFKFEFNKSIMFFYKKNRIDCLSGVGVGVRFHYYFIEPFFVHIHAFLLDFLIFNSSNFTNLFFD